MPLYASLAQLSLKEETSWGETPTQGGQTTVFGALREKVDVPDPKRIYEVYRVIGSGSRIPTNVDRNEVVCEGTIPFVVQNGKPLVFGLGKSVRTGSDPYTHTIQTASALPSMCIESVLSDGVSDYVRYTTGAMVNRMTLEGTEKGIVKASLEMLAKSTDKTTNTKSTVSNLTTKPYQFHQTSTNLSLWGSPFAKVKKWSLTVDNHLIADYYWQSADGHLPGAIREEEQTVELRATIVPDDLTIFEHIGAATEFDVDMVITRGTSDSIEFKNNTSYKCVMPEAPHAIPEKGIVETDVLIYMKSLEIVVVDDIATYPNETT